MLVNSGPRTSAVAGAPGGAAGFLAAPVGPHVRQQVGSLNAISEFLLDVGEPGANLPTLPPERPSDAAAAGALTSLPAPARAECVDAAELFAEQAIAAARQRTGGIFVVQQAVRVC